MRFLLILFVALSLTLAWQSSVIADVSGVHSCVAAEKAEGEKKKGAGDEEPDCD